MQHSATLSFAYSSPSRARLVARALEPEVGDIDDSRSRMRTRLDSERLVLTVEAADFVALRAALNTWLSLVDVAERCGRSA